MALPDVGNDIEFVNIVKSTGRVTVQMRVNKKFVFVQNHKARGLGKKAYFKCIEVSFKLTLIRDETQKLGKLGTLSLPILLTCPPHHPTPPQSQI